MEYKKLSKDSKQLERQEKISVSSQSVNVHRDDSMQLDISQEILAEDKEELIAGDYKNVSMKDNIDELGGRSPVGPEYIGMDLRFARRQADDSKKMQAVRDALADFLYRKDNRNETKDDVWEAANRLVKACDKYSSGRFRAFKWGRGRKRLDEVMALRNEAMKEMEKVEGRRIDSVIPDETEYEFMSGDYIKDAGLGKKIISGVGAFFGVTVGNLIKLATFQPLWRKNISWKPQHYYRNTMEALNNTFGRVVTEPELTLNDQGKVVEVTDENGKAILKKKRVYNNASSVRNKRDREALEAAERRGVLADIEMLNSLYEGEEVFDEEEYLDGGYMEDMDTISDLKRRNEETRKRLAELKGEEVDKFRQEMREISMNNMLADYDFDDARLDMEDEEYYGIKLDAELVKFENLDLNTLSFLNHVDMLRDFEANRKTLDEIRATHYQLMRGVLHGYKIDDERLIKLRAKFACAFELQQYMFRANSLVQRGMLDLTKPDDEIREQITKEINSDRYLRKPARVGDIDGLLEEFEKGMQSEYDDRKNVITGVYNVVENGGVDAHMPRQILKDKMDSYETNCLIYDYVQKRNDRFTSTPGSIKIAVYNERHNAGLKATEADRLHFNWLYGKETEEYIRLTRLYQGLDDEEIKGYKEKGLTDKQIKAVAARNKLEYYKEMIRDLKSISFSDFDAENIADLFENFERKVKVTSLYANSKDIAREVENALNDIRNAEIEEMQKKDPEYKPNPKERLKLPEEFAEFGYGSFADFKKDMYVTQDFGNNIQSKLDTLAKARSQKYLAYYSPKELFELDGEKQDKLFAARDSYRDVLAEKGIEDENDEIYSWFELFCNDAECYDMAIRTRPLTQEEKDNGVKQQTMTRDVDIMEVLEEEKAYYDRMACSEGRDVYKSEDRKAESEKGKAFYERIEGLCHTRDALVAGNKNSANSGNRRKFRIYASSMAYFMGDTEEKTEQRIDALSVSVKDATTEQKQAMAKELESAFKLIMDFDLKELNIDKITDLIEESNEKAAMMTNFCWDFNDQFSDYEKLMDDPQSGTLLTRDEYREVRAKKDFLLVLNKIYAGVAQLVISNPGHVEYDGIKLLSLSEKELNEKMDKTTNPVKQLFIQNVMDVAVTLRGEGIYPGADMEQVYERRRVGGYDAPADNKTDSIRKKLKER